MAEDSITNETKTMAGSGGATGTGASPGAEGGGNLFPDDNQDLRDGGGEGSRGKRQAVVEGASKLTGQAGDRFRAFADDGKDRATGALDDVAKMIEDAAATLDDKVGAQFGGYARSASSAVSNLSGSLREKEVDDLIEDAREFVRKSPAVAIGAAAAVGFLFARVLRSGVDANRGA